MAKNSLHSSFIFPTTTLLISLLQLLSLTSCSLQNQQPSDTSLVVDSLFEEKTRLGSIPPSCHNKCNQCHPCMAVQVPTLPSHNRVQPGHNRVQPGHNRVMPLDYYDQPPSSAGGGNNRYSNYKPLGWKCRCGGHLYNP